MEIVNINQIEKEGQSGNEKSQGNNEIAVLEPEKIEERREEKSKSVGIGGGLRLIVDGGKETVIGGVGSGKTKAKIAQGIGSNIERGKRKGGNAFGKIRSMTGLVEMNFDSGIGETLTGGGNGGKRFSAGGVKSESGGKNERSDIGVIVGRRRWRNTDRVRKTVIVVGGGKTKIGNVSGQN